VARRRSQAGSRAIRDRITSQPLHVSEAFRDTHATNFCRDFSSSFPNAAMSKRGEDWHWVRQRVRMQMNKKTRKQRVPGGRRTQAISGGDWQRIRSCCSMAPAGIGPRQHPCRRPARIAADLTPRTINTCVVQPSSGGHRLSGGKIWIHSRRVNTCSLTIPEFIKCCCDETRRGWPPAEKPGGRCGGIALNPLAQAKKRRVAETAGRAV